MIRNVSYGSTYVSLAQPERNAPLAEKRQFVKIIRIQVRCFSALAGPPTPALNAGWSQPDYSQTRARRKSSRLGQNGAITTAWAHDSFLITWRNKMVFV